MFHHFRAVKGLHNAYNYHLCDKRTVYKTVRMRNSSVMASRA